MTDTKELRRLAEAATPGEWYRHYTKIYIQHPMFNAPRLKEPRGVVATAKEFHQSTQGEQNAAYIAAANPATILALLDRLDAAERVCELNYRIINGNHQDSIKETIAMYQAMAQWRKQKEAAG